MIAAQFCQHAGLHPAGAAIGALEHAATGYGVERAWRCRVNGQGTDPDTVHAIVDRVPGSAAVGAPERATIPAPGVHRARRSRVDNQGADPDADAVQAIVDRLPGSATV